MYVGQKTYLYANEITEFLKKGKIQNRNIVKIAINSQKWTILFQNQLSPKDYRSV